MNTKLLFAIIAISLTMQATAQTIPNAGFENWSWGPGFWYENPDGWKTNNNSLITPVVKDSDEYKGSLSKQVKNSGYAKSKFQFSTHPDEITAYIKPIIYGTDSAIINVRVFYAGSAVDSGSLTINKTNAAWALVNITVSQTNTNCDSLEIEIIGGKQAGTALKIDEFSFSLPAGSGISEDERNTKYRLFPNPFNDVATLEIENITSKSAALIIYNTTGQAVRSAKTSGRQIKIERQNLASGIYFFQLHADDGHIITSGKFFVE